jgi:putative ABC transport system permease protein
MFLFHSVVQGFAALARRKLRAALTMLGMVIGIGTVTGMVSVSEGLTQVVIRQLEAIGFGNTIVLFRPDWIQRDDGRWVRNTSTARLRLSDAQVIAEECPSVSTVLPETWERGQMVPAYNRGRSKQVNVRAATTDYETVHNWRVARGRFFSEAEVEREALVCVVGDAIARDLFPGEDPVGKELGLRRQRFRIVGVMERKGDNTPDFAGTDNTLVMPITTHQRRFLGGDFVGAFYVRADSTEKVRTALLEVKAVLSRIHRISADEAFQFFTSDEIIRAVGRVSFVLKAFLGGVASIALVVGGVGIMNMMLVTVTERTHEIGLRKAVGARRRHILHQFLIEAVVLGGIGGVAGIGLGAALGKGAALVVTTIIRRTGGPSMQWPAVVSFETAFLAMLISATIGVVAGLLPAFRAALLPPTEALRHE